MESSRGFGHLFPDHAEQKLWIAVLEAALHDALSNKDPSKRQEAREWFRDGGQNFELVCDLADFDAGFVRRKILSVFDQQEG
ncbi:MAG: hypothetical protein HQL90_01895 [Magnetococcales bacterium]|nr:hypothetical protein [Magnetococcales bacterium]